MPPLFKNYFKTAWRNLWANKVFSAINILGLSLGLMCCILIFLFIQNEVSYDRYNKQADNIYRVTSIAKGQESATNLAVTPAPWAPLMKNDYAEIRNYTRVLKAEKAEIGLPGQRHFYERDLLYVDSTFSDVFTIESKKGDIRKALAEPSSIILSDEAAKQYFGDENAIGKTLELSSFVGKVNVTVTAIAKKLPVNSHFKFNALVSIATLGDLNNFWSYHMFQSYVLLNNKNSAASLEKKFPGFVRKYILNNPQADGEHDISLQPLTSIHLHSNMTGEIGVNGDITYVYVMAGIAIFILLIACFNFINLSTARSLKRAKEVGLRKVIGAEKRQLILQFLGETTMFAIISLVLAITAAFLVIPVFNQLSDRHLAMDFSKNYQLALVVLSFVSVIGLIAGLYPALALSSFKPIEVLKGKFFNSNAGVDFRKVLVTLQFAVSIGLIASTIIVGRQLHFLQTKDPGFDKENVLVLSLPHDMDTTKVVSFKNALLSQSSIISVGGSSSVPGVNIPVNQVNDGNADLSKAQSMQMLFVDENFVNTMKMTVVAGRNFSTAIPTDKTEGFILNEKAVSEMGWKNKSDAIGKTIQWVLPNTVLKRGKVLGVVEDFNITPLKMAVQPLVMHYSALRQQYLYVRFSQRDESKLISAIKGVFDSFYPAQTIEYSFLDDDVKDLYTSEQRLGNIFNYFSLLAIVIASLGVLGLSIYSIQQRMKEIGVRKVLGGSVPRITVTLVKDFVKPVAIAGVIAAPVAWYAMYKWLETFAYRITLGWSAFFIAGVIALFIALMTISVQTIKAAVTNPVKSLRSE